MGVWTPRAAAGQFPGRLLGLSEYARLRLRRSELVRKLVSRQGDPHLLTQIEGLTEELNYGFWSNPGTMKAFLHRCASLCIPALSSPQAFEDLLTLEERSRLAEPGLAGRYYLGWLRLPQLVMEPIAFEQAMREQEAWGEQLGLFLDAFYQVPRR